MLKWTALSSCLLLVSTLTTQAEPGVSSPPENRSRHLDPAAVFTRARAAGRDGALLLLKDYTNQGDTLLKERLKDSFSNLKDMLKQGDSVLKEQLVEGVAQLKEQRKEGDERLKEELKEDVAWLKDRLAEGQTRMKEELAEEEAQVKEELARQREAVQTLKTSVKEDSTLANDDLKQQMSDLREELKNTKLQLQTEMRAGQQALQSTQETLQSTQETLQSTQETLQSTQTDLQNTQEKVRKTEEEVQQTQEQLQKEMQTSTELKSLLQAAEEEISSLKDRSQQYSHRLDLLESSDLGQGQDLGDSGSTFVRWGRTTCPGNTSLVYSGVVGGPWFDHSGGGSNYLCLVKDPQLDNTTLPNEFSQLHGSEYQSMEGHHDNDVLCSLCRAPQPTTIMIPATLTCPSGWTLQYKGHLVAERQSHKGRTEFVCLDKVKEHRDGGHENKEGALMYYVASRCTSLPCPPYVDHAVVTCVVCSM